MVERSAEIFFRSLACIGAWMCSSTFLLGEAHAEAADTGFVVARDEGGRFWFQRGANGERFLSNGVNAVSYTQHQPRPNTIYYDPLIRQFQGDVTAWARSSAAILLAANFNTVASWSSPEVNDPALLHTPILYVAGFEPDRCLAGLRPDFESVVEARTREVLAPYAGRTDILGVFLDNEMPWWGRTAWDVLPTYTLLERAFELEISDPARGAALAFLKQRYASPAALSEAYAAPVASWDAVDLAFLRMCATPAAMDDRAVFTEFVAEKFFSRSTTVVRRVLPNVLILGTRFAGDAPESVIRATAKYCDVIAVNSYSSTPQSTMSLLARYWLIGGKPLMVTEFSWRATENQSGNPNTRGAGSVVATQQDRADKYREFITELVAEPMVVGYHWFQWADESPQGRFDGEDSNFGIVDIEHGTYDTLLRTMREVNAQAAALHSASTRPFPTKMPERRGVTYAPGQHPGRPPKMSLFKQWVAPYEAWNAADAEISLRHESGVLTATYRTGKEYGVGVSFHGPPSQSLKVGPSFATDLDGYEFIVLDAEIPAGVEVHLIVNEAGAGAPWKAFDMSAGDDAEAYSSLPMIGKGTRSQYRVQIADLTGQSSWGNQSGARRVDMNAVGSVAFQLMGSDLSGTARIFDLYLER